MYLELAVSTVIDFMIFYIACNNLFDKRWMETKGKTALRMGGAVLLFTLSFLVVFYIQTLLIKYVLMILFITAMMYLFFDDRIINILMCVLVVYGILFVVDFALLMLLKIDINHLVYNFDVFILSLISKLIGVILVILTTQNKKKQAILESEYLLKFIIVSFLTIVALIIFMTPKQYNLLLSNYSIPIILIFNNFFIYHILSDFMQVRSDLRRKTLSEERAVSELNLWRELKEKDIVQRKIMHDYSDTLLCVRGLLDDDKIEELKTYVNQVSAEYKLSRSYFTTGNSILDVLMNTKYEKSAAQDITMVMRLDNLTKIPIRDDEAVIILSNLLNNAMEYCMKLPKEDRKIYFDIRNRERLEIKLRNPIQEEIKIVNETVRSTKEGFNHGIGLLNVKEIVERNNGIFIIDASGGYFTCYIRV